MAIGSTDSPSQSKTAIDLTHATVRLVVVVVAARPDLVLSFRRYLERERRLHFSLQKSDLLTNN